MTSAAHTTIQYRQHGVGPGGYGFTLAVSHQDAACAERHRKARKGKVVQGHGTLCPDCCPIVVVQVPGTSCKVELRPVTNFVSVVGPLPRKLRRVVDAHLGACTFATFPTYDEARVAANALYRALREVAA